MVRNDDPGVRPIARATGTGRVSGGKMSSGPALVGASGSVVTAIVPVGPALVYLRAPSAENPTSVATRDGPAACGQVRAVEALEAIGTAEARRLRSGISSN